MLVVPDVGVFAAVGCCCANEDWDIDPGITNDTVINSRATYDIIDIMLTRDITLKLSHLVYKYGRKGHHIRLRLNLVS